MMTKTRFNDEPGRTDGPAATAGLIPFDEDRGSMIDRQNRPYLHREYPTSV